MQDRQGGVWAGSYSALHHLKDGRWATYYAQ
jgi:hypothetical protein